MSVVVYGIGPENAKIMFIGEAPGATEKSTGEPFSGKSGARLDSWLAILGLAREDVYITNLVKEYLPKNRNPKKSEIDKWRPKLYKEIGTVDPKIIILLGKFAASEILGVVIKEYKTIQGVITQVTVQGKPRVVLPLYHPAFVNRSKKAVGEEVELRFEMLKDILENL